MSKLTKAVKLTLYMSLPLIIATIWCVLTGVGTAVMAEGLAAYLVGSFIVSRVVAQMEAVAQRDTTAILTIIRSA